jgi:hypothetical protein
MKQYLRRLEQDADNSARVMEFENHFKTERVRKVGWVEKIKIKQLDMFSRRKYDDVEIFSEGLAAIKQKGKWGFIDTTWKEVILFKYDYAEDFSEEFALACMGQLLNGKWGIIDKTGKEDIPLKYDEAGIFFEELTLGSIRWKRDLY